MKVIRPTIVTDDILTSSSLAENDYPAWSAATGYAKGARVIRNHEIYESAPSATNTGNDPALDTAGAFWLDVGATNRWAMFDQALGTISTGIGSITVQLTPGRLDSLALFDLTAAQVTVTMTVAGSQVYQRTQVTAAGGSAIDNWYDWFFAPIGIRTRLLFDDLPSYRNGIVTVLIEGAVNTSPVGCGTLLIGRMFDIGTTAAGAGLSIDDYSKKDRNDFGRIQFVERAYSDHNTYSALKIASSRADDIKATVASLRATPTVWIAEDGMDALLTYGIAKAFSIDLQNMDGTSYATIEVEGLV